MKISALRLELGTLNLVLVALCATCGCGTSYSWRSAVPEEVRTVSVPTFRNESNVSELGAVATRQLLREFQREGTFKLAGADAAVEVQGTVVAVESRGDGNRRLYYSRLTAADVVLVAKVSVVDHARNRVLIDNRVYRAEVPYADGVEMTAGRDLAIERAADELAREIVDDLTLFNWEENSK